MFPQFGVAQFPAYWIICPNRHLSRRAVKVFCDWLRAEAREHESRKWQLLASLGCSTRYNVSPDGPEGA